MEHKEAMEPMDCALLNDKEGRAHLTLSDVER